MKEPFQQKRTEEGSVDGRQQVQVGRIPIIETRKRQTPTIPKGVKIVVTKDEIGETTIARVVAANVKPTATNLVTRPLGRNEI